MSNECRVKVLILAAGSDQSIQKEGYPLCLTEIKSVPLIQQIILQAKQIPNADIIVNFREDHVQQYHLDDIVRIIDPNITVVKIHGNTQGAACTALLSVENINNDHNLLIINCNEYIKVNYNEVIEDFKVRKLDAGVIIFHSIHPRYSYVRLNENGFVIEASEKKPISSNATAGFYWYLRGKDFVDAAMNIIRKDVRVNDLFYICPTFNEMILNHKLISYKLISEEQYFPIKSESQLEKLNKMNL